MTSLGGQSVAVIAALLAGTVAGLAHEAPPAASESRPAATAPAGASQDLESQRVGAPSGPARGTGAERDLVRREVGGPAAGWGQMVLALAIVIGVLLVVAFALKRLGGRAAAARGGPVEVLARSTVGPKQQLLLVRLGAKLVLVGSSPAGLNTLHVVADAEEVADLTEAATGTAPVPSIRREAAPAAGDGSAPAEGPRKANGEGKA
jgi:flagellar protein FliO/FliZ